MPSLAYSKSNIHILLCGIGCLFCDDVILGKFTRGKTCGNSLLILYGAKDVGRLTYSEEMKAGIAHSILSR